MCRRTSTVKRILYSTCNHSCTHTHTSTRVGTRTPHKHPLLTQHPPVTPLISLSSLSSAWFPPRLLPFSPLFSLLFPSVLPFTRCCCCCPLIPVPFRVYSSHSFLFPSLSLHSFRFIFFPFFISSTCL